MSKERHWAANTVVSLRKVRAAGPRITKNKIPSLCLILREKNNTLKRYINPQAFIRETQILYKFSILLMKILLIMSLFYVFCPLQIHLVATQTLVV